MEKIGRRLGDDKGRELQLVVVVVVKESLSHDDIEETDVSSVLFSVATAAVLVVEEKSVFGQLISRDVDDADDGDDRDGRNDCNDCIFLD